MTTFCLMILFAFSGCEEIGYKYVIDERIHGKWETGANGEYGWLIDDRTMTCYENGEIYLRYEDLYSDNGSNNSYTINFLYNNNHNPLFNEESPNLNVDVFGNNLIRIRSGSWYHECRKVDNFRWEGK